MATTSVHVACHYCRVREADSRDHIVPKSAGGSNRLFNRVDACRSCNSKKGTLFPSCRCNKCVEAVKAWHRELGEEAMEIIDSQVARADARLEQISREYRRTMGRRKRLISAKYLWVGEE